MSPSTLPTAHGARPWTPPDTDSDHLSDPFQSESAIHNADKRFPLSPETPSIPHKSSKRQMSTSNAAISHYAAKTSEQSDVDTDDDMVRPSVARPHQINRSLSTPFPHTPIKASTTPEPQHRLPCYPYTPDSVRSKHVSTLPPHSPLPPMPWNTSLSSSPIQNALFSCLSHLESLIQTRQPNDDQIEYLISKFEEMAQILSAPEAQSRQSDDHLFSELDVPSKSYGLGITNVSDDGGDKTRRIDWQNEYVETVGKYIEGVGKYAQDLKSRLDEVKQLNSIQVDIINDLRKEVKGITLKSNVTGEDGSKEGKKDSKVESPMVEKRGVETDTAKETGDKDEKNVAAPKESQHVKAKESSPRKSKKLPYQTTSFWTAIGEALDAVGDLLYEH